MLKQGVAIGRRVRDAAGVPRRHLREPVQPLRAPVARLPPGRGRVPRGARGHRPVLRAQQRRARWCRSRPSCTSSRVFGPEYTNRFNLYRAVEITGEPAPGYSSGQAMAALEEVAHEVLPPEMGYEWNGPVVSRSRRAAGRPGVFALSLVFVFLILAALYESWSLPLSVLLSRAGRGGRRASSASGAADSTTTSTRRSAS